MGLVHRPRTKRNQSSDTTQANAMNAGSIQQIKYTGPLALAIMALPFSITFCHLALIILGIIWIVEGQWKEKFKAILKNYFVIVFILFFLLHLLGVIYSSDKQTAWFSLEKKISLIALPVILGTIQLQKEDARLLFYAFVISCLAATVICLGVAFREAYLGAPTFNFDSFNKDSFYSFNPNISNAWMYFSYVQLASGIGIHPSYFSLYLVFCIFLLIHFHADSFQKSTALKKTVLLLLLLYLSIFILLLSSRIMILSLLLASFYGIARFLKNTQRSWYWSTLLVYFTFFSALLYLNPVSRFRGYQELVTTYPYLKSGLQTQSTTIRASLWSMSIQSLPKINWLIGVGTGDVEHLISETSKKTTTTNILGSNDPHNQYLQTLIGLGVLGLATLLICFGWPAYVSYQNGNFLYLGFVFLFSILCLTETAMELQKGIVFYSLFGSLLLFQYQPVQLLSFSTAKV